MQTIVLAENDRNDEQTALLAIDSARVTSDVVVLRDGVAVVNFFLGLHVTGNQSSRDHCDLMFMNLALPRLDGLKVLRQLHWLYRYDLSQLPPIVALSDSRDEAIVADAYRHGASGFLCKMLAVPELVEAIQQALRYWLCTTLRPLRGAPRQNVLEWFPGARH